MRTTAAALALAAALLLPPASAAAKGGSSNRPVPADLEETFYRAFYQETGLRDFEAAAGLYERAAALAREAGNGTLLAKSLLGRARCRKAAGDRDGALALAREVLALDPGNAEAKALLEAPEVPAEGVDPELAARIRALVQRLGTAEQAIAAGNLQRIGPRAVPFLAEGLRSREVGVVDQAAGLLATFPAPGARQALAEGLLDHGVAFPHVLLEKLQGVKGTDPGWPVVAGTVLRIEDEAERSRALDALMNKNTNSVPPDAAVPFLKAVLRGSDAHAVKRILAQYWRADTRRALLPDLFPLLDHQDPEVRGLALKWFAWSEALESEWAGRIRGFLDSPEFDERFTAFTILQTRDLLAEGERNRMLGEYLRSGDSSQVLAAIRSIASNLGTQRAKVEVWDPSIAPALVDAMRRALRRDIDNVTVLQHLGYLMTLGPVRESIPPGELVSLLGEEAATDPWAGFLGNRLLEALGAVPTTDVETAESMVMAALRLPTSGSRTRVLGQMTRFRGTLSRDAFRAVADHPDRAVRNIAYSWATTPVPGALAELRTEDFPRLEEDLEDSGDRVREMMMKVVEKCPDPALAPAIRGLLGDLQGVEGRFDRNSPIFKEKERLLERLLSCIGAEALPEARALFMKSGSVVARSALVRFRGEAAVEDFVAYVVAGGSPSDVTGAFHPEWGGDEVLPTNAIVGFYDRLPADSRRAEMLTWITPHLSPEDRAERVLKALTSERSDWVRYGIRCAKDHFIVDAWPRLVALLENPDRELRTEALEALDSLRTFRNFRAEYERFGEGGKAKALDDARALLKDGDPVKRRGGALALGALGDAAAVPSLLELLDDADAGVREAALSALESLGGKSEPR